MSNAAVAIAWVLSRGDDIVAIPGCSRRATLTDSLDALRVTFSSGELARIDDILASHPVAGTRYPEKQMKRLGL